MPDRIDGKLFCGEGFDGWQFYSSEEELIEDFDKNDKFWGGEAWIEMDDDLLSMWYERIFSGIITNFELPINLDITKQKS